MLVTPTEPPSQCVQVLGVRLYVGPSDTLKDVDYIVGHNGIGVESRRGLGWLHTAGFLPLAWIHMPRCVSVVMAHNIDQVAGDTLTRYGPKVRLLGWWPFRRTSWQVWDMLLNEWAPNALCGGGLTAALQASEGLNEYFRKQLQETEDPALWLRLGNEGCQ